MTSNRDRDGVLLRPLGTEFQVSLPPDECNTNGAGIITDYTYQIVGYRNVQETRHGPMVMMEVVVPVRMTKRPLDRLKVEVIPSPRL